MKEKINILNKIHHFAILFENICSNSISERKIVQNRLLNEINNLDSKELTFLKKHYDSQKYKIPFQKYLDGTLSKKDGGAVQVLRHNLLEYLINDKKINADIIDLEKKKITAITQKTDSTHDPFHSWKIDRILYSLIYQSSKNEINTFLESFANELASKLKIKRDIKTHVVHYDGSQNQGFDHCWIAIYDKQFRSQQDTKQIYVGFFKDDIKYDIYEHKTKKFGTNLDEPRGRMNYSDFDLETIVGFFDIEKKYIFALRDEEKQLKSEEKQFHKNKFFSKEIKNKITDKIYSETSSYSSSEKIVSAQRHHFQLYNSDYFLKYFDDFDNFSCETNNIDIVATKNQEIYLFEFKPCENSKNTIREALGQIIEYQYKNSNENIKYLCILGIKPLGENKEYFNYLKELIDNSNFKLKYLYVDYDNKRIIEEI